MSQTPTSPPRDTELIEHEDGIKLDKPGYSPNSESYRRSRPREDYYHGRKVRRRPRYDSRSRRGVRYRYRDSPLSDTPSDDSSSDYSSRRKYYSDESDSSPDRRERYRYDHERDNGRYDKERNPRLRDGEVRTRYSRGDEESSRRARHKHDRNEYGRDRYDLHRYPRDRYWRDGYERERYRYARDEHERRRYDRDGYKSDEDRRHHRDRYDRDRYTRGESHRGYHHGHGRYDRRRHGRYDDSRYDEDRLSDDRYERDLRDCDRRHFDDREIKRNSEERYSKDREQESRREGDRTSPAREASKKDEFPTKRRHGEGEKRNDAVHLFLSRGREGYDRMPEDDRSRQRLGEGEGPSSNNAEANGDPSSEGPPGKKETFWQRRRRIRESTECSPIWDSSPPPPRRLEDRFEVGADERRRKERKRQRKEERRAMREAKRARKAAKEAELNAKPKMNAPPQELEKLEREAQNLLDNHEEEQVVGPALPPTREKNKLDYGKALRPGEGSKMAAFVQDGVRIPRRGEIGLTSDQISKFEDQGYVMSGSRNRRMEAVRIRKENQVYSAEELAALSQFSREERTAREERMMNHFRMLVDSKQGEAPSLPPRVDSDRDREQK